jgi:protein-arginine kinase
MGVHVGILPGLSIDTVNRVFLLVQPAHLQKLQRAELSGDERSVARADFLRGELNHRN